MMLFVLLGLLYIVNLRNLPRELYGDTLYLIAFLNVGFAGLILAAFLARFVFPSLSGEGLSFCDVLPGKASQSPGDPDRRGRGDFGGHSYGASSSGSKGSDHFGGPGQGRSLGRTHPGSGLVFSFRGFWHSFRTI